MTQRPTAPVTVRVAARALAEWPWLPPECAAGAVLVGPLGDVVRLNADGTTDLLLPGGHPHAGAASDPTNGRKTT